MKLFHLYPEGGPAPPMTSSICVFHLGFSLVLSGASLFLNPAPAEANEVPQSIFKRKALGYSDYAYNWDFKDDVLERQKVDWAA